MGIYLETDFSVNESAGGFKTCASRCEHIDGPTKPQPNGRRDLSSAAVVRVLVVEDFEPFRRFVALTLAGVRDLQVIGEVSDGLAAVQKAVELQPDLILLDIGLPTLNGFEAARQIRKLVPKSRIIFLSQESSAYVVQEALSIGAWGYVVKTSAGTELLAVVEAVMSGKRFVSST
jgi:DNA-binding NarL/FixJ family response regulator